MIPKFKLFATSVALFVLLLAFQNCAPVDDLSAKQKLDTEAESEPNLTSIQGRYPELRSIEPIDRVSLLANGIECIGSCIAEFSEASTAWNGLTNISCDGDLAVSGNRVACSKDLRMLEQE